MSLSQESCLFMGEHPCCRVETWDTKERSNLDLCAAQLSLLHTQNLTIEQGWLLWFPFYFTLRLSRESRNLRLSRNPEKRIKWIKTVQALLPQSLKIHRTLLPQSLIRVPRANAHMQTSMYKCAHTCTSDPIHTYSEVRLSMIFHLIVSKCLKGKWSTTQSNSPQMALDYCC